MPSVVVQTLLSSPVESKLPLQPSNWPPSLQLALSAKPQPACSAPDPTATTASPSRPRPPPGAGTAPYTQLRPASTASTRLLNPLNHLTHHTSSSAAPGRPAHPHRFSDSAEQLLHLPTATTTTTAAATARGDHHRRELSISTGTHSAYSVTVLPLQGPRVAREGSQKRNKKKRTSTGATGANSNSSNNSSSNSSTHNRRSLQPREITIMGSHSHSHNQQQQQQQYLSPDDGMLTDTDADTSRSATPNIRLPLQMMEPALFRGSGSPDSPQQQQQQQHQYRRGTGASNGDRSWLGNPDRDSRSSMGLTSEPGVQLDDLRRPKHSSSIPSPLQSPATIPVQPPLQPIGDEESRPATAGSRESEWNSSHPCYPHRNPYVPVDSPLYASTRIIRISRDFMVAGDQAPAYSNVFPDILEPHVSEDQFRVVVASVNEGLREAFDPWNVWNWVDALLGVLTLWLVEEVVDTHCKRVLRRVEGYLRERNRELEVGGQKAVFVPLRRSGYMNLDIQIPDPIPLNSDIDPSESKDNNSDAGSIVAPLGSDVQSLQSHMRMSVSTRQGRVGSGGELSVGSFSGSLGPYLSR